RPAVLPDRLAGDPGRLPRASLSTAPDLEGIPQARTQPAPVAAGAKSGSAAAKAGTATGALSAMPAPLLNFDGLARGDTCGGAPCGADTPPDANGDVGPHHYIQAVNRAYAIYDKLGVLQTSFTEDQLWSTSFNATCKTQGRGNAVVLYDALADRWILTHAAHAISGADLVAPFYQCIAVSATADPVAGGWILYPIQLDDAQSPWFHDDARFGIWHDCLYMAANEVAAAAPQPFQGVLFASFSRADLYTSSPLHYAVGRIVNASDPYAMLPGNLTGQAAATIPPGTPNYYVAQSPTGPAVQVRKFTPGPNCGGGGILGAPVNVNLASTTTIQGAQVPQPGTAVLLDAVGNVLMQKNQYRRIGAQESLWIAHTIRNGAAGNAGIQWAQIDVTGGVVATTPLQQHKHFPDATLYRWLPSLAADGQGNMAVGYSTSNGSAPNYPSIAYAGRLVGDAPNALPQSEVQLLAGGGAQTGSCNGAPCGRWGGYSAMSVDPADDCTFWYTNQYYGTPADGSATPPLWRTHIGSFRFPACASAERTADLAITKTDGATSVKAGAAIRYTIVVTNQGPFAATGAAVTDTLPAAITGASWTCVPSIGSACPGAGSGNINTTVSLLSGGTATFVVSGTVDAAATGMLSNTASVAAPAGMTDPVAANDAATDTDTIVQPAAGVLAVTLSGSGDGTVTGSDLQIDCGSTCAHAYAGGAGPTLTANPAMGFVFTGWLGACTGTSPCQPFIDGDTHVSATFAPDTIGVRTLDVDGNGPYDALTDGLLVIRYLFGLTGQSLTDFALGSGAQRGDPAAVLGYLADVRPRLDVDGNGAADALTDGLLIVRYLFNRRGTALTEGAIGAGATRGTAPAIELYIQGLRP
ncbi:MAG: DUF11 domain-containing protein, partial [Burkholderiales bacterium]|nr:DUF11 domain-containing protein [Burkholderiales bacterium]